MKNKRLTAIDGLCAISSMGIIIYHVNTVFDSPFPLILSPVFNYGGYFGNYMFFIISGLLISLRYKDRLCSGEGITRLVLKRLRRIYPTYFLSNFLMIVVGGVKISLKRIAATFLMVSTGWFYDGDMPYNYPAWFICVAMLCYIVYFIIGKLLSKFSAVYLFVCCFFVALGAALEVLVWNIPFLYRVCGEGYMNFFLGVLLGEILNVPSIQRGEKSKRRQCIEYLASSMIICTGIVLLYLCELHGLPRGDFRWWISLFCACLVTMALSCRIIARVLSASVLQMIGRCSLSLCLWHIPLIRIWQRNIHISFLSKNICFILYILLVLIVSFLSYHYIEKAFLPEEPLS